MCFFPCCAPTNQPTYQLTEKTICTTAQLTRLFIFVAQKNQYVHRRSCGKCEIIKKMNEYRTMYNIHTIHKRAQCLTMMVPTRHREHKIIECLKIYDQFNPLVPHFIQTVSYHVFEKENCLSKLFAVYVERRPLTARKKNKISYQFYNSYFQQFY